MRFSLFERAEIGTRVRKKNGGSGDGRGEVSSLSPPCSSVFSLSSQFPRGQKARNVQNPTETLATQTTSKEELFAPVGTLPKKQVKLWPPRNKAVQQSFAFCIGYDEGYPRSYSRF